MARGRGGPQQPIKGFRPGKEPPQLKKRQAKQQFGDLSPSQERLVEMFAERTPEESQALVGRWQTGLLVATVVVALLAALLFTWSVIAGIAVGVVAVVLLFLWLRLRRQAADLKAMADAVSRGGRRPRRGGRNRR